MSRTSAHGKKPMPVSAYNATAAPLQDSILLPDRETCWAAIVAIPAGVDTVKISWPRYDKIPSKVIDRLYAMGGFEVYPERKPTHKVKRRRSWWRVIVIHNLPRAYLIELESIVLQYGMSWTRCDVRFDFLFPTFISKWKWLRSYDASLWIPYSRKVERKHYFTDAYADYVEHGSIIVQDGRLRCYERDGPVDHDAEYNGNYAFKTYARGKDSTHSFTVYANPAMLNGLSYPKLAVRLEVTVQGSSAIVRRFFPDGMAAIMDGKPGPILRQHVCLRIDGVNTELPRFPVPVQWEEDWG